jgi:hypothetical protein
MTRLLGHTSQAPGLGQDAFGQWIGVAAAAQCATHDALELRFQATPQGCSGLPVAAAGAKCQSLKVVFSFIHDRLTLELEIEGLALG